MTALVTDSGRRTPARLAGSAILACQSDERLVSLVRSGHERAFEAIVERYRRPLLRYCRRILPESRTEDAVQQTFINAHAALSGSRDAIQLKPWLFTIARNASLNLLRQNGWDYDQIPLDFDGVRRPDQVVEQRIQLQQTVDAVNDLPERQRSALVMREFEGRSYEEIGVALSANDGAVRQLLNRARVAMRTAATALVPPPLVARIASANPSDGRRAAEVLGALGAGGVAKAGATALVAGSLVVGAVKAPLPIVHHDKPAREKATLADNAGSTKTIAASTGPGSGTARGAPAQPKKPAVTPKRRSRTKRAATTAPVVERGDDRSGSDSNDRRSSGSGDAGSERSGSDDSPTSGSGESSGSAPGDALSGSDDVAALDSSGTSGSASSETSGSGSGVDSSGSGSDIPAPIEPLDDH